MKSKLSEKLGVVGYWLAFLIGIVYVIAPTVILDFPFWLTFVCILIVQTVPFIGALLNAGLYIWAFTVCLSGPQDIFAVIFYVCFALFALTELIPFLLGLFSPKS